MQIRNVLVPHQRVGRALRGRRQRFRRQGVWSSLPLRDPKPDCQPLAVDGVADAGPVDRCSCGGNSGRTPRGVAQYGFLQSCPSPEPLRKHARTFSRSLAESMPTERPRCAAYASKLITAAMRGAQLEDVDSHRQASATTVTSEQARLVSCWPFCLLRNRPDRQVDSQTGCVVASLPISGKKQDQVVILPMDGPDKVQNMRQIYPQLYTGQSRLSLRLLCRPVEPP